MGDKVILDKDLTLPDGRRIRKGARVPQALVQGQTVDAAANVAKQPAEEKTSAEKVTATKAKPKKATEILEAEDATSQTQTQS